MRSCNRDHLFCRIQTRLEHFSSRNPQNTEANWSKQEGGDKTSECFRNVIIPGPSWQRSFIRTETNLPQWSSNRPLIIPVGLFGLVLFSEASQNHLHWQYQGKHHMEGHTPRMCWLLLQFPKSSYHHKLEVLMRCATDTKMLIRNLTAALRIYYKPQL